MKYDRAALINIYTALIHGVLDGLFYALFPTECSLMDLQQESEEARDARAAKTQLAYRVSVNMLHRVRDSIINLPTGPSAGDLGSRFVRPVCAAVSEIIELGLHIPADVVQIARLRARGSSALDPVRPGLRHVELLQIIKPDFQPPDADKIAREVVELGFADYLQVQNADN